SERRGLTRALETDVAGGRPRNHRTVGVGDGHAGVVERALDVGVPVNNVLLFLAPDLLGPGRRTRLRWHGRVLLLVSASSVGKLPRLRADRAASTCRRRCTAGAAPSDGRKEPWATSGSSRDAEPRLRKRLVCRERSLLARLLLAGDRLLRALTGTGVGLGALTTHRQTTPPTKALVAPDLDLPTDVGVYLAPKITFDLVVLFDELPQLRKVVVAEVLDADVRVELSRGDDVLGAGTADAVDVGQRDLQPLLAGEVNASESCHWRFCSFLSFSSGLLPARFRDDSPSPARSRERYPGPGPKLRG